MAIATIVFVAEVIYGTIKGFIWFGTGKKPKDKERFDRFHLMMHHLMKMNLRLHPWLDCSIHNTYNETFSGGEIAICNHQSLLDTLCMLILSPKILIIANRRVIHNPIVKALLYYAEFACIESSIEGLLDYCRRQSERGYTIVIFPEGLRSKHCDIQRFHSGAFYLASQLNLDIIPLFIHGSGYALPVGGFIQNRAPMSVEIGRRIKASEHIQNAREYAKRMRIFYEDRYESICREREKAIYFRPFVTSIFSGINVQEKTKELIRRYNCFSEWINREMAEDITVLVVERVGGLFSLFLALVHPYTTIYACGAMKLEEKYIEKKHLPHNLLFVTPEQQKMMEIKNQLYMIDSIVTVYEINNSNL